MSAVRRPASGWVPGVRHGTSGGARSTSESGRSQSAAGMGGGPRPPCALIPVAVHGIGGGARCARGQDLSLALAIAAVAFVLAYAPACGQDFASPAPPAASVVAGPADFLERALPLPRASPAAEALETRWYEVPGLTTRAVALAAGWRSVRAAAGISRTGEPELGWTAAAAALGVAGQGAGAALRCAVRRDTDPHALDAALGPGTGLEAGGGAWVEAGAGVVLFASAPQIFTRGAAPPLARGLEIGAAWSMDDLALRLARVSAPGGAGAARHEAAFALRAGPFTAWLEARDQPARGALGLAAHAGPLAVAGVVESHPLLGETVRLSLALGRPAAP